MARTPLAKKTGGLGGAMSVVSAGFRRFPYPWWLAMLCACANESGYEGQTCSPSLTNLVVEISDLSLERIISKGVLDAIASMGYWVSEEGYATDSQECFIKIDRPEARFIRISQYVYEQDPSGWRSQMKEALKNEMTRLGLDGDLLVLEEITLKE